MKVAALVILATVSGGLLALFGMVFLNRQPCCDDDDIHGGTV